MPSLLKGVAFVTGAASGIGKATAYSFAKHGAKRIALADINFDAVRTAAYELKEAHSLVEVLPVHLDASNEQSIDDAVAETVSKFGRVDYAVNNAGIGGPLVLSAEHSRADWQKVMDVNLNGVWMSQRAEIRQMLKQESMEVNSIRHGKGVIVNVASMYGLVATSLNTPAVAYTASKHGVIGLTKADAATYARDGIRINAICPGYVATPLIKASVDSGVMQKEIAKSPIGRMAEMEEIADAIAFLVSPLSSFMCGSAMVVDGGFTCQ